MSSEPDSLQLRILRFGFLQDGDVGVGVFPKGEEIFAGGERSKSLEELRLFGNGPKRDLYNPGDPERYEHAQPKAIAQPDQEITRLLHVEFTKECLALR